MRFCTLLLATLLATVPLAGRAADPLEIHTILPLTGPGAFLGKQQQLAASVVEDLVNKSGGVHGRPIKFVIEDDQSNPQIAVQLVNGAIAQHPAVVIGGSLAAICNAIIPLVNNGPVLYCLSPGVHPADGSYVFSANITAEGMLAGASSYARQRGWLRVAAITSTDTTGQDADRGIDATFNAQNGFQIVDREHFNPTDISVAAQIARVKASGAQVLIAWATGTPVATVLRATQDAGLDIPLVLGSGNVTYAQMKAYAGFLPKNALFPANAPFGASQLPKGALKQRVTEFYDAFKAVGVRPDVGQITPWDALLLIVSAYRKLGPDATAAQVREYLTNLRGYVGAMGPYDFRAKPQRGLDESNVLMVRWDTAADTWVGVSTLGGKPLK
jgi:branched-chain amino acid transport system substrate-binding protein